MRATRVDRCAKIIRVVDVLTQVIDKMYVERTGNNVGELEIFDTFEGATLVNYIHEYAQKDAVGMLKTVERLDDVLAPMVADSSITSNFNKSHTATFYRRLNDFLPCLLDIVIEAGM